MQPSKVIAQDMDDKTEAMLKGLAGKLARVVEFGDARGIGERDRLNAAYYHGCLKPVITMRSTVVMEAVSYHIVAAQKLVEVLEKRGNSKK